MIYFVKNGNDNEIKIGYADNVKQRMCSLQTSNSNDLKLIGVMEGEKVVEQNIHERFAHLRVRGEWFTLSDELRDFVNANCYTENVPTSKMVVVNPTMAQSWLEQNSYSKQRKIRKLHVALLAREMRLGRFQPTAQVGFAILNDREILVNGQHTLHAIIQSGLPQVVNVVYHEVDDEYEIAKLYFCYDIHKKRTFGEIAEAFDVSRRTELSTSQVTKVGAAVLFIATDFSDKKTTEVPLMDRAELVVKYSDAAKAYYDAIRRADREIEKKIGTQSYHVGWDCDFLLCD